MRSSIISKRSGFSLLEMVIALALGMVLLLGLYVTLSVTVTHGEVGREAMNDGAVARSVMARINSDICSQIGAIDPRVLANNDTPANLLLSPGGTPITNTLGVTNAYTENDNMSGTTSGSSGTASGSSGSSSGSSGTTSSGSTGSSTGGSSKSSSSTTGSGATGSGGGSNSGSGSGSSSGSSGSTLYPSNGSPAVYYNVGIRGDSTSLIISVYHMQRPPTGQPTGVADPVVISDVTRINYWLISNGADAVGLARQEIKQATSTDIDLALTDVSNPNQYLISDEVKNVKFEYFDGTTWQPEWDGSVLAGPTSTMPNGSTPIGPPRAIRVTLTLRRNTKMTETISDYPDDATNTFVHVIALPTSNNPYPALATTTSN